MLERFSEGAKSRGHSQWLRIVTVGIACLVGDGNGGRTVASTASTEQASDTVRRVSLIQLIATPEKFEGHRVQVEGFCRFVFEEHSLYLHREDSELLNTLNAVWLDTSESHGDLNDSFVRVAGTFTQKGRGHLGMWPGSLVRITRLERARTRSGAVKR